MQVANNNQDAQQKVEIFNQVSERNFQVVLFGNLYNVKKGDILSIYSYVSNYSKQKYFVTLKGEKVGAISCDKIEIKEYCEEYKAILTESKDKQLIEISLEKLQEVQVCETRGVSDQEIKEILETKDFNCKSYCEYKDGSLDFFSCSVEDFKEFKQAIQELHEKEINRIELSDLEIQFLESCNEQAIFHREPKEIENWYLEKLVKVVPNQTDKVNRYKSFIEENFNINVGKLTVSEFEQLILTVDKCLTSKFAKHSLN